jgi:hypothetical protein
MTELLIAIAVDVLVDQVPGDVAAVELCAPHTPGWSHDGSRSDTRSLRAVASL